MQRNEYFGCQTKNISDRFCTSTVYSALLYFNEFENENTLNVHQFLLAIIVSINDSLTFDCQQQQPSHDQVAIMVWYLVAIAMCCSNDSNEVQDEIHCNMGNNSNIA